MMEILLFVILLGVAANALRLTTQRRRIALLGSYLGQYQIEKHMQTLTEGYLRALGEADPVRRDQIWQVLGSTEQLLSQQFQQFGQAFSSVAQQDALVSRLPLALPYAHTLWPRVTFDARQMFSLHARAIVNAATNAARRAPRDKAFTMMAEMLLMQHSCHWFCRSKAVASARLQRHQNTSYAQLLDAVAPDTRQAYLALLAA